VDNPFGRRVGLLIIPYSIIALIGSSLVLEHGQFFPPKQDPNRLNQLYYADEIVDLKRISMTEFTQPLIPSRYIAGDFLEVFLSYNGIFDNTALKEICPEIKAPKRERLLFRGAVNMDFSDPIEYPSDSLLLCFSNLYRISIADSLIQQPDLMFYEHPVKKIPGLLGIIDISHLPKGRNELAVQKYSMKITERQVETDYHWREPVVIPFWKTDP
jgi:hypothetical protein